MQKSLLLALDVLWLGEIGILLEEYLICLFSSHIEVENPLRCVRGEKSVSNSRCVECVVVFKFNVEKVCNLL